MKSPTLNPDAPPPAPAGREFLIDNLLVRIHFMIEMIWWTGLAPWEFEFPFPGSLISVPPPTAPPSQCFTKWATPTPSSTCATTSLQNQNHSLLWPAFLEELTRPRFWACPLLFLLFLPLASEAAVDCSTWTLPRHSLPTTSTNKNNKIALEISKLFQGLCRNQNTQTPTHPQQRRQVSALQSGRAADRTLPLRPLLPASRGYPRPET